MSMFASIVDSNLKRTLKSLDEKIKEREALGQKSDSDLIRINAFKKLSDYLHKLSRNGDISYKEERASRELILDWMMKEARKIDIASLQSERSEKFGGEKGREDLEREMLKYMRTPERRLDSLVGLEEEMQGIIDRIIATIKHGPGSSNPLPGLDNPYKSLSNFLFIGEPGTGKTFAAEGIGTALRERLNEDVHLFVVQGADIKSSAYGESERRIATLLDAAQKQNSISIIFADEFDEIANRADHEATMAILNTLLGRLSGSRAVSKVVFIGATNRPWVVDPAIYSRFQVLEFPLPDENVRLEMFTKKLWSYRDNLLFDKQALLRFAIETEGFSGRDIDTVIEEASVAAFRASNGGKVMISERNVFEAIEEVKKKKSIQKTSNNLLEHSSSRESRYNV